MEVEGQSAQAVPVDAPANTVVDPADQVQVPPSNGQIGAGSRESSSGVMQYQYNQAVPNGTSAPIPRPDGVNSREVSNLKQIGVVGAGQNAMDVEADAAKAELLRKYPFLANDPSF